MIQCERGHFFDENRYASCPYCSQFSNQPRSVTPPVAPNMQIPAPSCGKTVAIPGMDPEPTVGKTVAIDGFDSNPSPIHKTVAISEPPLDFPPVTPIAAPAPSYAPASQPVQQAAPAFQPAPNPAFAPAAHPVQAPVAAPSVASAAVDVPVAVPVPSVAPVSVPVAVPEVSPAASPALEIASDVPETQDRPNLDDLSASSVSIPVTGLGVTEHPTPIEIEEKYYQSSPDRPYAVTGLGVKENPTPVLNEVGATFPVPSEGGNASVSAQPGQAEAAAFAAFGFPGGPIPGMVPGVPRPGTPAQPASAPAEEPAVSVETPAPEVQPEPAPAVQPEPAPAPVVAPAVVEPAPRDPNATVSITESEMDYLPRIHARAFLVCTDGPMTGASYVFQESRAIIGRQKNYEIALYRDNSVSRSPHAIINYYKDSFRYTVSAGDAEKKVSVNGTFIDAETDLKMYDIIGIGQTRLLFIPVCSEKFAW